MLSMTSPFKRIKNLSIYFEFDVSTDWASILEGKTLLTLGFDCTTDTKMYNWLHDLDWVSTNSELKRPEEIEKKRLMEASDYPRKEL